MAEKTSSNSNEAFSEAEKNELQIETKRAQYYLSVLEQEIHMLQQELSEISRESEEWNNQFFKTSNKIFNKIKQQDEIRDIIIYIQEWAEIDTDNSFLYKLRDLNTKLEAGESLEIKKLIQIKEALILESSNLRAKIESEITINKLKEILDGRMFFSWSISKQKSEEFTDLLIKSIISEKWVTWIQEQSTESSLDIAKKDFYKILVRTFKMLPTNEVSNFRRISINITLQWSSELFWANDGHYLDMIEIIVTDKKVLETHNKGMIENLTDYVEEKEEEKGKKWDIPSPRKKPKPKKKVNAINYAIGEKYEYSKNLNSILSFIQWQDVLNWAASLIIKIEGYVPYPYWDHKQWSWWNGTKVPNEVVNKIPKKVREKIIAETKAWKAKSLSARVVKTVWKISEKEAIQDKMDHIKWDYKTLKKQNWFNEMTKLQQMSMLSFSYNLGAPKLVSDWYTLARALKSWESNGEIADKIMKFVFASNKVEPWLVSRRQLEIEVMLAPELKENQKYATVHPKTWVWLGKVTSNLIKELTWDDIPSWVIAVRMEHIEKLYLQKWDWVVVSYLNDAYIVSVNWEDKFKVLKNGKVLKVRK